MKKAVALSAICFAWLCQAAFADSGLANGAVSGSYGPGALPTGLVIDASADGITWNGFFSDSDGSGISSFYGTITDNTEYKFVKIDHSSFHDSTMRMHSFGVIGHCP